MNLEDLAVTVRTRDDLARFVLRLKDDLLANPQKWENRDLSPFLEAMAGWIADMEGYYKNTGQDLDSLPPWRIVADMLMGARVYE